MLKLQAKKMNEQINISAFYLFIYWSGKWKMGKLLFNCLIIITERKNLKSLISDLFFKIITLSRLKSVGL